MTPWTAIHQVPLSMRFSRQGSWSGLPFPSPGDLPNPGIEPRSPALQANSLPTKLQGKPLICGEFSVIIVSNIYHFPFSHSEFPIMCMLHFFHSPTDLEYSVLFSLFTFCFSVLAVSIEMSSNSEIPSSAMSKTNESIRSILHSCYSALDLSHFFFSTFRIFISLLHCLSLLQCRLL